MGFKPRQRRVTVYWIDSSVHTGWNEEGELTGLAEIATTGYIIVRAPDEIVVAGSVTDNGLLGEVMTIPRSCVQRIERWR